MPNRLAHETSPYLRQHADNPVDWYPWGEDAFERARTEQKPILLSVGYSTCHWCHVMAHESFENPEIAAAMNEGFINIKVDREERPDVDSVYMTVTQAMTGQGGWPMTVFLTPDLEPFYAGTYFPPQDGHGRPGFPRLLEGIQRAWRDERDKILDSAAKITEQLRDAAERAGSSVSTISAALPEQVVQAMRSAYDDEWGGFGRAPKFPSPSNLEFLLMHHHRMGNDGGSPGIMEIVLFTLEKMAAGGIYDHLGGGFARYSVDRRWLVPHFEKMLYDNAQLVRLYLHGWQLSGDPGHERIVRETLRYLLREMQSPEGGFYSAQDADSEGIEGKFFVWTPEELDDALGPEEGAIARAVFDVTAMGNFEDPHHPEFGVRSVLSRPRPLSDLATELQLAPEELEERVEAIRARLFQVREERVHPGLDDKVLTSWNGLALAAFAEAGRVLGDEEYVQVARLNAAFVREHLWRDGVLLHTYREGTAKIAGMLEDYAYYGLGLIELYRATGDLEYLSWAADLLRVAIEHFHDDQHGGFYEAAPDGEQLIFQQKPFFDAATPSGNGAMAQLAAWLGRYYERDEWEALATEVVGLVSDQLAQAATGFGATLQALELVLSTRREVAIVGHPTARAPFEREVAHHFLPAAVIAPADSGGGLPVLEGRDVSTGAVAYVCENLVCGLPATTVEALRDQLKAAS